MFNKKKKRKIKAHYDVKVFKYAEGRKFVMAAVKSLELQSGRESILHILKLLALYKSHKNHKLFYAFPLE